MPNRKRASSSLPVFREGEKDAWLDQQAKPPSHSLVWFALRDSRSGDLLGACGALSSPDFTGEPELGYWVRSDRQARGYATEALTAVVEECKAAGFRRVWAAIRPEDEASVRVAASCGLRWSRTDKDEAGRALSWYSARLVPESVDDA